MNFYVLIKFKFQYIVGFPLYNLSKTPQQQWINYPTTRIAAVNQLIYSECFEYLNDCRFFFGINLISFLNVLHSQFDSYERVFTKISIASILTERWRRKKNLIDTIPVSSSFHLNDKSLCLFSVTTLNWNADLIIFYIAELFVWMSFLARDLLSVVVYVWREPFNLMLMFGLFNNSKKRCVHTTDNTLRSTLLKPYLPSWCVVDSKPKYCFSIPFDEYECWLVFTSKLCSFYSPFLLLLLLHLRFGF